MKPWTITSIPPERWRLTPAETDTMDMVLELWEIETVARERGVTGRSVYALLTRAREKMGAANITQAAVAWDRYSRERA